MDTLSVIADVCSVISLVISLFVASQVLKISNRTTITGNDNNTSGGNMTNVK